MQAPDDVAKIKEGCRKGVEAILQFLVLLPGRHFIGDEEALKVNSEDPMFMDC